MVFELAETSECAVYVARLNGIPKVLGFAPRDVDIFPRGILRGHKQLPAVRHLKEAPQSDLWGILLIFISNDQ